MQSPKW